MISYKPPPKRKTANPTTKIEKTSAEGLAVLIRLYSLPVEKDIDDSPLLILRDIRFVSVILWEFGHFFSPFSCKRIHGNLA